MSYSCCNIITLLYCFKELPHIKQMRRYLFQGIFRLFICVWKVIDSRDKFEDMTDSSYITLSYIESLHDHTIIDYTQIRFVRNDAKADHHFSLPKAKAKQKTLIWIFSPESKQDTFLVPYAIISQFPVSVDSTSCQCHPKWCISPWPPQDTAGTLKLR